ncbi:MAG TPA: hypothetical protein VMA37_07055 [Acetobacteraceae bacterium]|nr:hypothetical protein [Acetobacteraceae bacterium]
MTMEATFLNLYGAPLLQAMVGFGPQETAPRRRIARDLALEATEARRRAELEQRFERGGTLEAAIRALIYIRLPEGTVDERGFSVLRAIRAARPAEKRRSVSELKTLFRDQYLLLRLDEARAVAAIPKLLAESGEERGAWLDALRRVLAAPGVLSEAAQKRLREIERLFGAVPEVTPPSVVPLRVMPPAVTPPTVTPVGSQPGPLSSDDKKTKTQLH